MNNKLMLIKTIFLCLLINMVDGFDITLMAVTAQHIATDLQITQDKLGIVFSSALAGMVCGATLLTIASDLLGRRVIINVSLALISISVLATYFVENYHQLLLLRFISGIAGGALLACQAALVSECSPDKFKALAVCIVTAGYPLGAMCTGIIAQEVIELYSWRLMFLVGAGFSFVLAILAFFFLPESKAFIIDSTEHKGDKILPCSDISSLDKSQRVDTGVKALFNQKYKGVSVLLWLTFFLCFCTIYFLMSWMPKLLTNAGFDSVVGQQAFSFFNLGGVVGTLWIGFLAIKRSLIMLIIQFLSLAVAAMFAFSFLSYDASHINSLVFCIGVFIQGGFVGMYALSSKSYPTHIRATGIGWAIGVGRLGAVFGPALAGFLVVRGMTLSQSYLVFALPVVISVFLLFQYKRITV